MACDSLAGALIDVLPRMHRVFLYLIAVATITCAGADWPHLRGPAYDGVSLETGLADAWPKDGPPLLWARELGQGYSGFVVVAGKLFTQRQSIGGQYLLCLDAMNGQTIWETRYDIAWQPGGAYPGPYASPTWYRDRVYFASTTGLVGCADAATGALRWSRQVLKDFQGAGSDFGYAATPLVEDDRVILPVGGPDSGLVALHADDGRTMWTAGGDSASYCPAVPITLRGRRLIVGYMQNTLLLAELATGKIVHRQPLSRGYDEHAAWPLYQEPHLLLTAPFRAPAQCLRLEPAPDAAVRCATQWTSRSMANDVVSSVLYQGHVYGFDLQQLQASRHRASRGAFRCLDWATGQVCWSSDAVGQAALVAADGKLLMLNDSGSVILARADATGYQESGRYDLFMDEICWTPPALCEGRLYVRSPSRAVCLFVGNPDDAPPTSVIALSARPWRLDITWLVSREREYPNDALSYEELATWFLAGIGGLAVAMVVGAAVRMAARRWLDQEWPATLLVWSGAFLLGMAGTGILSAWFDCLLFTWPLALYAVFHGTVLVCWWAHCHPTRRSRWLARLALAGLLLAGFGYFELCRAAGLYICWAFLAGFPAAFPLTLLAAHTELKGKWALVIICTLPAFALCFSSGQAILWWKSLHAG
jgi:outer membrane protein assembly factor BamB